MQVWWCSPSQQSLLQSQEVILMENAHFPFSFVSVHFNSLYTQQTPTHQIVRYYYGNSVFKLFLEGSFLLHFWKPTPPSSGCAQPFPIWESQRMDQERLVQTTRVRKGMFPIATRMFICPSLKTVTSKMVGVNERCFHVHSDLPDKDRCWNTSENLLNISVVFSSNKIF